MFSDPGTVRDWRVLALGSYVLTTFIAIVMMAPLPQDPAYHAFADQRTLWGIPNGLNVLSNVPFLLVGIAGVRASLDRAVEGNRDAWFVFFAGVALVSVGSAFYHWSPDSNSLVWDRIPMTIGFMGLMVALSREYLSAALTRHALAAAIIAGISSVLYWQQTDDLRFYAWVQFMPLGLILLLVVLYKSRYTHHYLLGVALFLYALAKVTEYIDARIMLETANLISGHSIKHLLAAAAGYLVLVYLQNRQKLMPA